MCSLWGLVHTSVKIHWVTRVHVSTLGSGAHTSVRCESKQTNKWAHTCLHQTVEHTHSPHPSIGSHMYVPQTPDHTCTLPTHWESQMYGPDSRAHTNTPLTQQTSNCVHQTPKHTHVPQYIYDIYIKVGIMQIFQ